LRTWRRFPFEESLQSLRFLDHGQVDAVLAPPDGARDFRYLRLEAVLFAAAGKTALKFPALPAVHSIPIAIPIIPCPN
jgi:hypothetical protein